ncbi:tyrosine-type recombinase/integrase [Burkholderia stagnalis]|uniref:tyrosine-type recombinase/integrase n=1 Tax=Burkholderia stagnalis TaxID=1503054 RepID=UPI0021AB9791|nr:integrase arm-type DNA-binding domain-containing protein [Burkholderia stagnalis]
MKTKPLTDAKCRNARFDEAGGNKLFDGGGLYLDLRSSGSKKWRLKYRFNGKENLLTFGDYPATSLADARSRRDEAKRLLAEGKNPAFERDVEKQTRAIAAQNTFEAVALEWYEAQQATWSASHANRVKKQLDREVFPLIGQRPISSIGAPDLLAVIRRIEGREAFETARKTLQTCGQVFRYAVATSRAERDPSPDLRGALKAVPVKHMARVGESELPELLRSIATYEGEPETRLALRFLALTFVRTIELRQAEWTEIDLERREWRIPAEKMKMLMSTQN